MACITYASKRLGTKTLIIVRKANIIINDYAAQGFVLTLRQLYYQFIGRDWFPESWIDIEYNLRHGLAPNTKNTEKNYKKLGVIINDARLAGLIDWDAIEDRTRSLCSNSHWDSPGDIIEACANQFQVDKWQDQKIRPEVWIEKEALEGVIEKICKKWDVPYFSCRGYTSQSAMWRAGQRLDDYRHGLQKPIIFYLGDHDPSGLDMTRDVQERLRMFTGVNLDIRRIALTREQIDEYEAPPNPAKITDSRAEAYISEHGSDSWELDALEPAVIVSLIDDNIKQIVDIKKFNRALRHEKEGRTTLKKLAEELK